LFTPALPWRFAPPYPAPSPRVKIYLARRAARHYGEAMIYELAELDVKPGQEDDFIAAAEQAKPFFLSAKGCLAFQVTRSIEQPQRFRLLVQWETLDDHMVGFRNSDNFTEWRRLAGPYFASPPRVEHLEIVVAG
jgi:heme-degrading monooxygenase HmoA